MKQRQKHHFFNMILCLSLSSRSRFSGFKSRWLKKIVKFYIAIIRVTSKHCSIKLLILIIVTLGIYFCKTYVIQIFSMNSSVSFNMTIFGLRSKILKKAIFLIKVEFLEWELVSFIDNKSSEGGNSFLSYNWPAYF